MRKARKLIKFIIGIVLLAALIVSLNKMGLCGKTNDKPSESGYVESTCEF